MRNLFLFIITFAVSFSALVALDLTPKPITRWRSFLLAGAGTPDERFDNSPAVSLPADNSDLKPTLVLDDAIESVPSASPKEPLRLIVGKIGLYTKVGNPESRDVAVLDRALLSGVVHYPGSGNLNDKSNLLMFGHSSHLPNVRNQNFKVFNRLSELNLGDEIRVESKTSAHIYKVTSVALVEADEALVEFSRGKKMITLSTCNTFGAKQERFVVEAVFVDELPLET